MEVLGIGLGDAPALSVETGGVLGEFPCGLGEDGPGARAHGREGCLVEGLGVEFTDPSAGSAQERLEVHRVWQHERDERLTQPRRRLGVTLCGAHDPV